MSAKAASPATTQNRAAAPRHVHRAGSPSTTTHLFYITTCFTVPCAPAVAQCNSQHNSFGRRGVRNLLSAHQASCRRLHPEEQAMKIVGPLEEEP